jgi:hypothetical protein
MTAITLRNIPPEVARAIQRKASEEKTSLNRAVIRLLEEALEMRHGKARRPVHHDLDELSGSWNDEEAESFDEALKTQRSIDSELWA